MLSRNVVNFLTKSSGSEATSDRRSFPRPDSPHPRKLKQLGLLSFEDKENVPVELNQSSAKKSPVDTRASMEPPTFIANDITDILSPLSSSPSLDFPFSTISPSSSAMANASGFGEASGDPPFSCSLSNISPASSMARASGFGNGPGQSPFSCALSGIASSSSMTHGSMLAKASGQSTFFCSHSSISPSPMARGSGFGGASEDYAFSFLLSNISPLPPKAHGSGNGKTKCVTWAKNQETEISTPVPSPFWQPGEHFRPPHLTGLEQVLARIRLHKIPLMPSEQSCSVRDEDEDKNFYDQYYDIDMRCERRLYLKERKSRIRKTKKLVSSGNEEDVSKTEIEGRLELQGELRCILEEAVETLENELENVRNEAATIESKLQSL